MAVNDLASLVGGEKTVLTLQEAFFFDTFVRVRYYGGLFLAWLLSGSGSSVVSQQEFSIKE